MRIVVSIVFLLLLVVTISLELLPASAIPDLKLVFIQVQMAANSGQHSVSDQRATVAEIMAKYYDSLRRQTGLLL